MIWNTNVIDCSKSFSDTTRNDPFTIIVFTFKYQTNAEDKGFLDEVIKKGRELANKVYAGAANNAIYKRPTPQVIKNCVAGVFAEQLWKIYLNHEGPLVVETEFDGAEQQIDLLISKVNKKVEVRSSFPRNGIEFAICHGRYQFDVLGPYANNYKPSEIQKDYYVRTLFHLEKLVHFSTQIKRDGFQVVLAGGATWRMMSDDKYFLIKDLQPENEYVAGPPSAPTSYRVIPYSRALDTKQIYDLIKAET